ncbi:uncharacterized protein VDAG_02514 [Verticillium dahliae VdLs.17]|uniref:Uncharacterized protein n=1 Tax=Verticillium dahliae (strain VdLs.17 / ATCC MYA-4575 / FGSC 10137) TaxID=498257 RepID=G2WY32_VERDV|nr:uncharacterized protein VDAG_02514 [Verticillium dahliae VdLs.17]EGY20990.1 hypothetical protein VDAG_02514 [Verticillium dahliae VdLs.17]
MSAKISFLTPKTPSTSVRVVLTGAANVLATRRGADDSPFGLGGMPPKALGVGFSIKRRPKMLARHTGPDCAALHGRIGTRRGALIINSVTSHEARIRGKPKPDTYH